MPVKSRFWLKLAAALLGGGLLMAGAAAIALKSLLSPEKLKTLAAENGRRHLHREVRFKDFSVGVVQGLTLEGFEVSERPDFQAGTFARVGAFKFRIRLRPLLERRIVVDRIRLEEPEVTVVLGKDGKFNFSDLTDTPAKNETKKNESGDGSKKDGSLPASAGLELNIQEASLHGGKFNYNDIPQNAQYTISSLEAKVQDFNLKGFFPVSMSLRAANSGGPRKLAAQLSLAGKADLSGALAGKIAMDLEKMSLQAAGLDTRLSGKIRLDPEVFEFSNIKGEFAGGLLSAGLKVRDYAKAPDAELEVNLTKLDLAKLLAANAATLPEGSAGTPAASGKAAAPAPAAKVPAPSAPPMKTRGSVKIAALEHPGARASDARLSWDLKGITPDLSRLSGWAKLTVGEGRFSGLGSMSEQSRLLKVVLLPFTVLGKITSLGGIRLLPDLSAVSFSEIVGDYAFQNGVMTLKESRLESPAARVAASGTVDLPRETLALVIVASLAKVAPLTVEVGGTFAEPKPRLRVDKLLTQPVGKLLQAPQQIIKAGDLLKGLFKKKK